ncbi:HEPN domain-containing protein [Kurthia populi]|uniref:HEPN domain-containing protein n=1 Tax=Kurthia populi TaxID=1562132 RepID=A0ABW5Y1D1_9BACL
MKKLGKVKHRIDVSNEYEVLAKKDEEVSKLLFKNGEYKHAIYFCIQAMEKYIRSKIFSIVNPNLEYFRKRNQNHSVEDAIEFLLEIVSTEENLRKTIRQQLVECILGEINYQQLHNNLRYPFYSQKFNTYSVITYVAEDYKYVEIELQKLKIYLNELNRL